MLSNSTTAALSEALREHEQITEKMLDSITFELRRSAANLRNKLQVICVEGDEGGNGEGVDNV